MRPPCASLRGQGPVKAASRTADRRLGLADGPDRLLPAGPEVAIGLQGKRDAGVSEPLRNQPRVRPAGDQQRGMGMPEVMNGEVRYAGPSPPAVKTPGHIAMPEGRAEPRLPEGRGPGTPARRRRRRPRDGVPLPVRGRPEKECLSEGHHHHLSVHVVDNRRPVVPVGPGLFYRGLRRHLRSFSLRVRLPDGLHVRLRRGDKPRDDD